MTVDRTKPYISKCSVCGASGAPVLFANGCPHCKYTAPKDDDDEGMGALFRARKEASQRKRAANREASAAMLTAAGVKFQSKNLGAHLIIAGDVMVDFWPGTGLWIARQPLAGRKEGRGVANLIAQIKKARPQ